MAHGWRAPITISNRSGFVVRGHGRLLAALKLGLKEVPIDKQDYTTEAEEHADLIADNRVQDLATFDEKLLVGLLNEIQDSYDLTLTCYSPDELANLQSIVDQIDGFNPLGENQNDPLDQLGEDAEGLLEVKCPQCGYIFKPNENSI
jgi:hypothetical protein